MDNYSTAGSKHLSLSIEQPEQMAAVARALGSPVRLELLRLLDEHSLLSVNEIAQRMNLPVSSAALYVKQLEEAGLIATETQPGIRGAMKLSSLKVDSVAFALNAARERTESVLAVEMPVGGYSLAGNIRPTCGLASVHSNIGNEDDPRTLHHSERFGAQMLWFRQGYVEYHFSVMDIASMDIRWLELSFEACSEAPQHRDPWKSDIAVSINGERLGVWTSPCDCGGRRGRLTPEWWSDLRTQYGFLKTWRVDADGSYLENLWVSDTNLNRLALAEHEYISVRIEVSPEAEHVGGLNLFGERFGDHGQGILLRLGYQMKQIKDT